MSRKSAAKFAVKFLQGDLRLGFEGVELHHRAALTDIYLARDLGIGLMGLETWQ